MKTIKTIVVGVSYLAICLTGCSNEEVDTTDNNLMKFSVVHPSQQGSTRATATAFEANDRIGIFITEQDAPLQVSGNYVNNAPLTYEGGVWKPDRPIRWNDGTFNIYAYYPYSTPSLSVDDAPFSVATDQSTVRSATAPSGYEASDFLWAGSNKLTASGDAINLQFKHRMSKLLIRLVKGEDYEGELPNEAEVYIHNTVPSATIDLSVGVVTRNPHGKAQSIKAQEMGGQKFTAILVPQRIVNRQPLIEVIMKGVSYLYESSFVFKQGVQHTVSLIVSKNPEQVKIEVGGEIENWE